MATRTEALPALPDHVAPADFRPLRIGESPEFLAAPFDYMAGLHETHPPLFYTIGGLIEDGSWQLIKHEDALFMLRHPDIFSTKDTTPFPRDPSYPFKFIPLEIAAPDHRKFRNILDPMLSPRGVGALEDKIRQRTNELIDGFINAGECEFTEAFGRPLPVTIFLELMGLPDAMRDTFVTWAVDLLHSQDYAVMAETMGHITRYLQEQIEVKRHAPDEGAISRIVHAAPDGRPLAEIDVFGFVIFLFIAGLDTVFATLNNMWLWLADNPGRRHEIIDRPQDIDRVVEELLRVFSVTFSGRRLEQDHVMHGIRMKKGDRITAILPVCNYDPALFADPRRVDFDRPRKPTLAFTMGMHSCMGAHLARLEIKVALQEWLRRIPDFARRPGAEIVYRAGGVVGPKTVPLVW